MIIGLKLRLTGPQFLTAVLQMDVPWHPHAGSQEEKEH